MKRTLNLTLVACLMLIPIGINADCSMHDHADQNLNQKSHQLYMAITYGSINDLKQLLEQRVDPKRCYSSQLPIDAAVRVGSLAKCKMLIEYGANDLTNALMIAAGKGHESICKLLIKNGAQLVQKQSSHMEFSKEPQSGITSALMQAVRNNHSSICEYLIKQGADVNFVEIDVIQGWSGWGYPDQIIHQTPLMVAARNGHMEICKILIKNGAQVNAQGLEITTYEDGSIQKRTFTALTETRNSEIGKLLKSYRTNFWRLRLHRKKIIAAASVGALGLSAYTLYRYFTKPTAENLF